MAHNIVDLPEGVVSFANLVKPRAWTEADKPKFSVSVAWPVADYEAREGPWPEVKRAFHAAAVAKWGDRANAKRDGAPPYRVPFVYGADREKNPEQFDGFVLATFRSEFEVPVGIREDGKVVKVDASTVEKGMRVVVAVKPRAYQSSWKGVSAYAHAVLLVSTDVDLDFVERTRGGEGGNALAHFGGGGDRDDDRRAEGEAAETAAQDTARQDPGKHKRPPDPKPVEADGIGDSEDIPF